MQHPPKIVCIVETQSITFEHSLKAISGALHQKQWRWEFNEDFKSHLFCEAAAISACSRRGVWQMLLYNTLYATSMHSQSSNEVPLSICLYPHAMWEPHFQRRALRHLVEMNCVILAFFYIFILPKETCISCNYSLFFFNPRLTWNGNHVANMSLRLMYILGTSHRKPQTNQALEHLCLHGTPTAKDFNFLVAIGRRSVTTTSMFSSQSLSCFIMFF